MPVCAVHAPCLLFTQRVWGTEPWGKLERSAEMAAAVGAEVVVVHPPFRWQKDYARDFVDGIAALEESTGHRLRRREHVSRGGPRRDAASRCTSPAGTRPTEPYANTTIDLSHAAIAHADPSRWPSRLGDRLRHIHLTDGTGSAKDEHLVPGRGAMGAADFLRHLADTGFAGEVVLEINTRKCATREERERDLRESLEFAREHFAVADDDRPRREHQHRPRPATRRARTPGRRSSPRPASAFAAARLRRYDDPRGRRGRRRRRGAGAPLLRHQGRPVRRRAELPVDPRAVIGAAVAGPASTEAAERLVRTFLSVWDDPGFQPAAARAVRGILEPGGRQLIREGFLPVVLDPGRRAARHRPARAADAARRQPGDRPDPGPLRPPGRAARLADRRGLVAIYAPTDPAVPRPATAALHPAADDRRCIAGVGTRSIIHHMVKNAVEVRGLIGRPRPARGAATASTSRSRSARSPACSARPAAASPR